MEPLKDRFVACLWGLALGDALGARHEGGPVVGALWRAVTLNGLRWTDDTQMALGLAESLLARGGLDPDHVARSWAEGWQRWRGYGPGASRLLARIRQGADWREANRAVFPDGSFGNGAAMRAAPLGLYFHGDEAALRSATTLASSITHAHPLGIEGGLCIARAVDLALDDVSPDAMVRHLQAFLRQEEFLVRLGRLPALLAEQPGPRQVRRELGASVRAHESAVTAVYLALRFGDSFEDMMRFIIAMGGDTDTIGAMAGGIFGAFHGTAALPRRLCAELEARDRLERVAGALYDGTQPGPQ